MNMIDDLRTEAAAKFAQADMLERLSGLAVATGCPKGTPIIPWLEKRGLIERHERRYVFTAKAANLRYIKKIEGVPRGMHVFTDANANGE